MISRVRHIAPSFLVSVISGATVLIPQVGFTQAQDELVAIGLSCRSSVDGVNLTVGFRNIGAIDTSVFLGGVLANGKKYLATELYAEAMVRNGTMRYHYSDPSAPGIAGRLDAWVVTLPVSTNFELTTPLQHFFAGGAQLSGKQEPYDVRILIDARPIPEGLFFGIPHFKTFVGELQTDWVQIPGDCTAA